MLSGLSEWFWQERLWFPEGLGWADLEDREGRVYAKARDLWVALPIAVLFLIVRQIFERSVALFLSHLWLCHSTTIHLLMTNYGLTGGNVDIIYQEVKGQLVVTFHKTSFCA